MSRELRERQYRDSTNLRARAHLHARFGTNPYPWFQWLFDQLNLRSGDQVLEVGCGPGTLWVENSHRIPEASSYLLSDFSVGMVSEARSRLAQQTAFQFVVSDAQGIPYPGGLFDAVIANHMLYHVPDIPRALAEIHRVLKVGGRFYAATNGVGHMHELADLMGEFDAALLEDWEKRPSASAFNLENGQKLLDPWFRDVQLFRYPDSLTVTDTEALVAYVLSMGVTAAPLRGREEEFRAFVERRINGPEALHISKDTGLFCAAR